MAFTFTAADWDKAEANIAAEAWQAGASRDPDAGAYETRRTRIIDAANAPTTESEWCDLMDAATARGYGIANGKSEGVYLTETRYPQVV